MEREKLLKKEQQEQLQNIRKRSSSTGGMLSTVRKVGELFQLLVLGKLGGNKKGS